MNKEDKYMLKYNLKMLLRIILSIIYFLGIVISWGFMNTYNYSLPIMILITICCIVCVVLCMNLLFKLANSWLYYPYECEYDIVHDPNKRTKPITLSKPLTTNEYVDIKNEINDILLDFQCNRICIGDASNLLVTLFNTIPKSSQNIEHCTILNSCIILALNKFVMDNNIVILKEDFDKWMDDNVKI